MAGFSRIASRCRSPSTFSPAPVTCAMGGGFRGCAAARGADGMGNRHLSDAEWHWTRDFVARGGTALRAYPIQQVTQADDGRWIPSDAMFARRHRMSIGTIVTRLDHLKYRKGGTIGTVEESFVARMRPWTASVCRTSPRVRAGSRPGRYVRRASSRSGAWPMDGCPHAALLRARRAVRRKLAQAGGVNSTP